MTTPNNPKALVVEIAADVMNDIQASDYVEVESEIGIVHQRSMEIVGTRIADRLDQAGLLVKPGYIGEIDAGDWELATIRLDIDRQMFKDGQVRMGGQVLIIPQPQKE